MVENDIYDSKGKYEKIVQNIERYTQPERSGPRKGAKRKYHIRNSVNVKYFKELFAYFAMKDMSYVHRVRLFNKLLLIGHATKKDLRDCTRDDINQIVAFMHENQKSPKSKRDFILDMKYMWKHLFPDKDQEGRPDETIVPYVVRHLSAKIDKSREKRRKDKLIFEEIEKLIQYFSNDSRMQAFLTLAFESLGRPQELLYLKISDVELQDNYAKVWISEHGKEGIGFLRCIESFPYVSKWYNTHPLRDNPQAFLFVNLGSTNRHKQMKPRNVNKKIREACEALKIDKPITCYSLKRNGVTFRRLRGDSDVEIQHVARWTSTQQLKTYDLSASEDSFRLELVRRGIIAPDEKNKQFAPDDKKCGFCGKLNGIAESICENCFRPLDRKKIERREKEQEENTLRLQEQVDKMKELMDSWAMDEQFIEMQAKRYLQENMPRLIKELASQTPVKLKQTLVAKN